MMTAEPGARAQLANPDVLPIGSTHVLAWVCAEGGILWAPRFRLSDDRWVSPLVEAPWVDEVGIATDPCLPPTVKRLGGAFLGLPFGGRGLERGVAGWSQRAGLVPHHGFAAQARWNFAAVCSDQLRLELVRPEADPLARVEQHIRCMPDRPAVEIVVRVEARSDIMVPLAYHPILRLPRRPGELRLEAAFAAGHVFPALLNPLGKARPGARFDHLSDVPSHAGKLHADRLPLGSRMEDLLLLMRCDGPVTAEYLDEGYRVTIDWDRASLPNCLLWIHDRALAQRPWDGRFRGVGIEPGASPFDLALGSGEDPLTRSGETTAVRFRAGETRTFRFTIEVSAAA